MASDEMSDAEDVARFVTEMLAIGREIPIDLLDDLMEGTDVDDAFIAACSFSARLLRTLAAEFGVEPSEMWDRFSTVIHPE